MSIQNFLINGLMSMFFLYAESMVGGDTQKKPGHRSRKSNESDSYAVLVDAQSSSKQQVVIPPLSNLSNLSSADSSSSRSTRSGLSSGNHSRNASFGASQSSSATDDLSVRLGVGSRGGKPVMTAMDDSHLIGSPRQQSWYQKLLASLHCCKRSSQADDSTQESDM